MDRLAQLRIDEIGRRVAATTRNVLAWGYFTAHADKNAEFIRHSLSDMEFLLRIVCDTERPH